jgi:hypothetical protein
MAAHVDDADDDKSDESSAARRRSAINQTGAKPILRRRSGGTLQFGCRARARNSKSSASR